MFDSPGEYYSKNLDCISGCFKVEMICAFLGSSNTKLGRFGVSRVFEVACSSIELELFLEKRERHANLNFLTRTRLGARSYDYL